MTDALKFDEKGLIPAIVQDAETAEVLMMAYMNRESLEKTLKTGETWFFSRRRNELWHKGETSGNIQKLIDMRFDCDGDTLLIKVKQTGNACHTGNRSCFFNPLFEDNTYKNAGIGKTLLHLYDIVEDRKNNPKEGSYTNYLFEKGLDKILKKVGEESAEVIIASKNMEKKEQIYEIADFLYHLTVLMSYSGIEYNEIAEELINRHK